MHRALRQAGVVATLQVFEAQSHAQFYRDDRIPEVKEAFGEGSPASSTSTSAASHPTTPDGRYFVVRAGCGAARTPALPAAERAALTGGADGRAPGQGSRHARR